MKQKMGFFVLSIALAVGLMGCTDSVDLQEWPEQAVYTVINDDGETLLVALDPTSESAFLIESLREIGADGASTLIIQNSSRQPLLAWSKDNGPTHFAVVDEESQKLKALDIEVDTGAYRLGDNELIALLPKAEGQTEIEIYSTITGETQDMKVFTEFPTMFLRGDGPLAMVGNTKEGSVFVQLLADKDPSIIAPAGVPGDALRVGDGIAISIANPVTESSGLSAHPEVIYIASNGDHSSFVGVEEPRLLAASANFLAVDDTTNGRRMIRVIDLATMAEVYSVQLESHVGVQGLASVADKFVVVQDEVVTWIDPVRQSSHTSELPGAALSGL